MVMLLAQGETWENETDAEKRVEAMGTGWRVVVLSLVPVPDILNTFQLFFFSSFNFVSYPSYSNILVSPFWL